MRASGRPPAERVVLVVDDEEALCHLTSRFLAEAGFRVVEAHTASEALALLSTLNGSVQLVVSDIAMPGMTGLELAATVATLWPELPVLLVSGQGGPPQSYEGRFLPKPFTAEALLEAVGALVSFQQS